MEIGWRIFLAIGAINFGVVATWDSPKEKNWAIFGTDVAYIAASTILALTAASGKLPWQW